MKKIIETKIQKRFADIDIFRHVNNISQMGYLDVGKTEYYRAVLGFDVQELGTLSPTLVIVATRSDFLRQVRYGDETVVRTWVERVGTKSITLRQQIVALGADGDGSGSGDAGSGAGSAPASHAPITDPTLSSAGANRAATPAEVICTESESALACFDPATQSAVEIPAAWRKRIGSDSITEKIGDAFKSPYGYPELDPLRDEICKCISYGLGQASITLTNHLLESALKMCLAMKFSIENKKEDAKLEEIFRDGIAKYDDWGMVKTINEAYTIGLITETQKNSLHEFRESFRNPWSHGSSNKIFGDNSIPMGMGICSVEELKKNGIESFLEKIFHNEGTNTPIKDVPPIQGIAKKLFADKYSRPYFQDVDKIVRDMLSKLSSKNQ